MSSIPVDDKDSTKASLKAWWSAFTKVKMLNKDRKDEKVVFGSPLRRSLKYASVAISMAGEDGQQYIWGYVPVIVAKVGLFLKENATEVEGVFRIAGSQKRMRELQEIFDTPPRYGKGVEWDKYSVHDAASVLRRYLNQMPEPIVPLQLYSEFRNVMIKKPLDVEAATKTYRLLITSMPPANQYLLLYVLDLLAVFARKSDVNRMPASNLAVIFQPGIFSHPSHLQDPMEHKIAVEVLEFLIVHQDHFVLGISAPPPTNVDPSELTSVSQPTSIEPDVAELSESDEELGDLVAHEGGGAKIARSSATSTPNKKKEGGLFARRSNNTQQQQSASCEGPMSSAGTGEAADKGKVQELGLGEPSSLFGGKAGVRRSRTTPSRKGAAGSKAADDGKRSASGPSANKRGGKNGHASKNEAEPMIRSVSQGNEPKKNDVVVLQETAKTDGPEKSSETQGQGQGQGQDALPTPPSSKLVDSAVSVEEAAA
ncbi:RhoGAP-domain-containing protein [Acaromyces ingoldii]|uniref:RhoGAP-domain-containing protein n=1 Tax=Acaromyces ingoldii TaxID=215250 RepID=A0A316YY22_9BASI|nr:RhoGAP-domain-containing protein [Acaromyces ingoldii]PWN94022.1 RhoGAP-domain-containing protein [Acaromyces ingoldii]